MLGLRFIKMQPTSYLLQYKAGRIVREGAGLSFFYYAPTTSLVAVPIASTDAPFIFNEVTSDFQEISIQGQATYRITDPKRVSQLLNFTLDASARGYVSDDPQKLSARVINVIKVLTRKELQTLSLRDALRASDTLVQHVTKGLAASTEISSLGLEVFGLSILAIKPNPVDLTDSRGWGDLQRRNRKRFCGFQFGHSCKDHRGREARAPGDLR